MYSLCVRENSETEIPENLASGIKKMLHDDPSLPIKLAGNVLSFAEYTIGSIQVGEYNIEIQPRNPVFTLEVVFEMLLYESLNNFDENYLSSGFGDNQSFGISSITSQFYYECVKLLDFGLTGGFVSEEKTGTPGLHLLATSQWLSFSPGSSPTATPGSTTPFRKCSPAPSDV